MKLFFLAAFLLVSSYSQVISLTGTWNVNATDFNCNNLCCCPLGTVNITPDPTNSSSVLVTPSKWSNNVICDQLGRNAGSSASYPFPPSVDLQKTKLMNLYTKQNEGFSAAFFNVTVVVVKTIGAYFAIDDSNVGDIDGSICQVTMIKRII